MRNVERLLRYAVRFNYGGWNAFPMDVRDRRAISALEERGLIQVRRDDHGKRTGFRLRQPDNPPKIIIQIREGVVLGVKGLPNEWPIEIHDYTDGPPDEMVNTDEHGDEFYKIEFHNDTARASGS